MAKPYLALGALAAVLLAGIGMSIVPRARAQGTPVPSGQDADLIAWQEIAQIAAPSGNPSTHQVEFETWASDQDIFESSPARWPSVGEPKKLQPSFLRLSLQPAAKLHLFVATGACTTPGGINDAAKGSGYPAEGCLGEEVRRNWASFQYIVSNGLDSHSGLARAFANKLKVDLPADAVEFKGDWAPVTQAAAYLHTDADTVRQHYYTSTATIGGASVEVALLSFHISTKQIKDWVWADFEGSMNPGRCDVVGCHDLFGATAPNVAPNATAWKQYGDCAKSAAAKAMLDNAGIAPVWQNYCLKGTQVTFVDASGKASLLGNSVIEPLNADVPIANSSCISCHAYASFNKDGRGNFAALGSDPLGNLDPAKMTGFVSNDFLWSPAVQMKP